MSNRANKLKALQQLKASRREGVRRSEQYDVEENELFEYVTDEKYQEIVSTRRKEDDFVVDDGECCTVTSFSI